MTNSSHTLNLLVIEDNQLDFLLIKEYLKEEDRNINLKQAASFATAKDALLSNDNLFDAIFLDLSLPDGFGENLITDIVALAGSTPVIVLTGYADKKLGINSLKLGVTDYLLKDELSPFLLYKSLTYAIERKKSLFELKSSEIKYKTLFHANPQPLWVYDLETYRFLDVNEAAIRHYGYTKEEFLAMTIKDIRPVEEVEELLKMVAKSRECHVYAHGAFRHTKKNGEIIYVQIQSNSLEFEDRAARLILANDVTDQIKAEQSLKLSEQRFKALVQDGSDIIVISDLEGKFNYASPTLELLLGKTEKDFLGMNAFDFVHNEDKQNVFESYSKITTQKRIHIPPYRFKDGKNNWRWIETIVTNMIDDPAVGGIVTNSRDVTDRVEYIRAIKEQNSKFREIAWTQSHLVRAPLSRILGIVDFIKNNPPEEKYFPELLDSLFTSAIELDDIIKKIVKKTEQVKDEPTQPHSNEE